jgi:predicted nuclease of restriction endonuclease-like (RecB) superfamily
LSDKIDVHEHEADFQEIVQLIRKARYNALKSVNIELINLYWQVGEHISKRVENTEWGMGVVDKLADYLQRTQHDVKGFNRRGLYRMKQFYETYCGNENVSSLLTQISWTNHLLILSKTNSMEEKEFYLALSINEKYTSRELGRQIDSGFYERDMLSNANVSSLLTQNHADIISNFKDTYVLDFLNLPHHYSEKDLQKGIMSNLKNFILEFGKNFTFVGEEYRIQVGNNDYYIDLLFFHRGLSCLVAFELKIDDFKPEYLGKINFYLEALDRNVKKPHENPSVGVILCKSKDEEVVEYALSRNLSKSMIAEYRTKLIEKEVLEHKLHELYILSANNLE